MTKILCTYMLEFILFKEEINLCDNFCSRIVLSPVRFASSMSKSPADLFE